MLNLKKGLALVLAAATAFTFAPVSSLTAQAARTWDDDGLTTTTGIDSINNTKEFALSKSGTSYDTVELQLAEHANLSSTGKHVKGYKVTVSKGASNQSDPWDGKYVSPITVSAKRNAIHHKDSTDTTNTITSGSTWGDNYDYVDTDTYIVDSVDGYAANQIMSGSSMEAYTINGAWLTFGINPTELGKTNASSFKVTIEALTGADESAATADDKTTFTINVQRDTFVPQIDKVYRIKDNGARQWYTADSNGAYSLPEGKTFYVTYRIKNYNVSADTSKKLVLSTGFVSFDDNTKATGTAHINGNHGGFSRGVKDNASGSVIVGTAEFVTGVKGSQTVYIKYQTEKDRSDDKAVSVITLPLNITAGNAKLYVTYDTQNDGQQTYTDNVEDQYRTGNSVNFTDSDSDHAVTNGKLTVGTKLNGATQTTTTGSTINETYSWAFNSAAVLPAAKTVYNADGSRTVQISASATATAEGASDVTYQLVAPDTLHDDAIGTTSTANKDKTSKNYAFNPVNGKFDGSLDGITEDRTAGHTDNSTLLKVPADEKTDSLFRVSGLGNAGYNDSISFTTAAAQKYGAIDNAGLVTLKSAVVNVPLYVVVTAKNQDKNDKTGTVDRDGSTYIIPVNITENQPLWVYVANESGYAEYYNPEITKNDVNTAANTLYLSKAKTSDKIKFSSNAGASYMSARITDTTGAFSYDVSTQTISVDPNKADANQTTQIVVTTTSAPNVEGTAVTTINVQYKPDWAADEQLVLPQDTIVRKGGNSSRKQIVATSKGSYTEVVFDRDHLYTDDASVPSGKREIRVDEAGHNDVILTSSGWVTYNKNAGSVYVRAYAKGSNKIPSGYTYALVKYGAATLKNDNTLTVSPKSLVLKPGETKTITATANTAITVNSADESVATVASAGSIVVKGVKQGQTVVTVTAVEDAANGIDSASYDIPVVVTDENGITKPAKVTGLKVKNKKGAKVSVTWKAQDKSVLYRVYKKVGNGSWKAKNVTNAKATLDVKKGAKVTVKVKAFRRDANGKAVWQSGKATKAKAFKTDKK